MHDFIPYAQPDLPYDFNALEPVISAEIMEVHYTKHHKAYITNLNAALEKFLDAQEKEELDKMAALLSAINFNGGGHLNHSIFWTNLAPESKGGGGKPKGALAKAIDQKFGTFEKFVEFFSAKTVAIQGSGWGWLGYDAELKELAFATCANQDALKTKGLVPLLGVDVWEHAYYLQYKNVRAEYVKNIWRIINWGNVEERFENANK
ncbi:MAG: superoxide dismutase [Verrucomicrobia bacterium]|nr:superoxide dismutase [Verrucomicrobiota bacterium]